MLEQRIADGMVVQRERDLAELDRQITLTAAYLESLRRARDEIAALQTLPLFSPGDAESGVSCMGVILAASGAVFAPQDPREYARQQLDQVEALAMRMIEDASEPGRDYAE